MSVNPSHWVVEQDNRGAWCYNWDTKVPLEKSYVPKGTGRRISLAAAEILCDQLNVRDYGQVFVDDIDLRSSSMKTG